MPQIENAIGAGVKTQGYFLEVAPTSRFEFIHIVIAKAIAIPTRNIIDGKEWFGAVDGDGGYDIIKSNKFTI